MGISFTQTQKIRLTELGLSRDKLLQEFAEPKERDDAFRKLEKVWSNKNRQVIQRLLNQEHKPALCRLQEDLSDCLTHNGFSQVTTPIILSRKLLERMTIDSNSSLHEQVFWLDQHSCLRPMLAPNLYSVSKSLMNIERLPLRIFEIGSCFRKESEGNSHLKEFTMLNLVEWGTEEENRTNRLKELAALVLDAAGIREYGFEEENSVVYGTGLDVVSKDGMELASTSMGPHPLDAGWKISCTWVGIGFGLERLLMYREHQQGIRRFSKSLSFLDGASLKIR